MALIILNSGGGGGGGGGLANIPVTNADGSVNVPATSLKFFNSLVVANGNEARITPNGSGGGSNTIIGTTDPTNTTQSSAVGQLYYNSITLQTFICTAIVSGVPATYTWNLITGITINTVAPTTTTAGFIGQLYVYNNNSVFSYYICISNANNSYTWNVISSGSGSLIVEKNETSIVSSTNTLNFTGTNITVQQDDTNPNQANISVNSGGGLGAFLSTFFTYTYSYPQTFGQFPLLFNLLDATSIIPSPPTGWLWSVDGGTEGTDYIFTTGKGKTTQNPQITFNVPPNLQEGYTLTLLPSSTAIPPISYISYSIQIPPQPLPFTTGTYSYSITINGQSSLVPYWQYSATDVLVFNGLISSYLKCQSLSITIATIQPNVPTFTITADALNLGGNVSSTLISPTTFPASYGGNVDAYMFNSDGITTTLVSLSIFPINYYVPAFYIQNQSLTAPTFSITSNQVFNPDGTGNYVAGLSLLIGGATDIQVVWVAYPQAFTTPPQGLVVFQGDYTGFALVSTTPVIQTIAGQVYNIYSYQVGYTGFITYNSELFLEIIPNIDDEPDTNLLLKTQAKEIPKTGFFQSIKRLFGAKS